MNRKSLRYCRFFVIYGLIKVTRRKDNTGRHGYIFLCLQKSLETSLQALSARSEPILVNWEKLWSRKYPASCARTVSTAAMAAAEFAGGRWHSSRFCALRWGLHAFISRRLPSCSPWRCRRCRDSPLWSGDDSPNQCLNDVRFSRKSDQPDQRHRHGTQSKHKSAHGTEFALTLVFCRY